MIRVLFGVLAILFVIMALLLDVPLLYLFAVLAAGVVAALVVLGIRQRRSQGPQAIPVEDKPQGNDLHSLGIMDIRPRDRTQGAEPQGGHPEQARHAQPRPPESTPVDTQARDQPSSDTVTSPETKNTASPEASVPPEDPMTARPKPKKKAPAEETSSATTGNGQEQPTEETAPSSPFKRVLLPLLSSMKEALDAHTVCLLKQEDLALEYYIEGLVSDHAEAPHDVRFVTRSPLLTATMAQRPVSIRHVGKSGVPRTSLGYYREPIGVQQIALAPIPRPNDMATHFLVADSLTKDALGSQRDRTMLAQYADLISTLLDDLDDLDEEDVHRRKEESVRPRHEIIAEEMEDARAEEYPLALTLIHLNRAEVLADDGLGAVASAERALRRRLEDASPEGRVERFGELTFGVFYTLPLAEVETWAADLQHALDAETGILEGGISIGVAMLNARHGSAQAFRADATTALQESYETGACIIVE